MRPSPGAGTARWRGRGSDAGGEHALAAVLERHLGRDVGLAGAPVECVDQGRVALGDEAAAHLLGAGDLAVVGIELLVQDEKAPDLRTRHRLLLGERAVHLRHVLRQHVVDLRVAGQFLVRAVDDIVALRPIADGGEVDVEHGADEVALIAVHHGLADVGIELELVLDVFRREQRAVVEAAHVLGPVDDLEMAGLGIDEAGIAGLDVAVGGDDLGGLGVVLEIAHELARRLEQDLAVLGDAQIDVGHHRPNRVGIDFSVRLGGDVEKGFGLAVELLQVQADRAVEREQVGPDRLARGIGDAHAREPEHVLERPVDQKLAERVKRAAGQRHRLAVEDLLAVTPRDGEEGVERPPLDRAGVLHADHDAGQHLLEHARRSEIEGRADLLQVRHRGVAALRAGEAEGGDQRLRIVEIVIPDPGERQIGERLVALGQPVEGDRVGRCIDAAAGGQHDALRLTGGAGGVEDDRAVGAAARLDLAVEPFAQSGVVHQRRTTIGDDVVDGMEAAVVVVAQPPRLVVDDLLELRQPLGHGQDLVDLLLVLDRREAHLGMGQHIGELFGDGVGVDRHRHGAEHLRRHHRPVEPGAVGPDDGDGVAARKPEAGQPRRVGARLLQHLPPGPDLPDAEVLVPVGRAHPVQAGVTDQELGERIRASGGADRQDAASLLRPRVGRACWYLAARARLFPRFVLYNRLQRNALSASGHLITVVGVGGYGRPRLRLRARRPGPLPPLTELPSAQPSSLPRRVRARKTGVDGQGQRSGKPALLLGTSCEHEVIPALSVVGFVRPKLAGGFVLPNWPLGLFGQNASVGFVRPKRECASDDVASIGRATCVHHHLRARVGRLPASPLPPSHSLLRSRDAFAPGV